MVQVRVKVQAVNTAVVKRRSKDMESVQEMIHWNKNLQCSEMCWNTWVMMQCTEQRLRDSHVTTMTLDVGWKRS